VHWAPDLSAPAIRTEGLSKRYGSADALIDLDLDLEVAGGEVAGYLRPSRTSSKQRKPSTGKS
jgi:hypothetical protein